MEFLQEIIKGYNLPFTILLGMVALYWIIALIGVIDFEALDGLVDLDTGGGGADGGMDADGGLDTDGGTDGDGHAHDHNHGQGHEHIDSDGHGFFGSLLRFLNATDVPLMFVLSLIVIFLWGINGIGNYYFNSGESGFIAGVVACAALVCSVLLTKMATRPLAPLMRYLRVSEEHQEPVIGRSGVVRSQEVTNTFGQIEVVSNGAPLLLHGRVAEGREPLKRGDAILVVDYDKVTNSYIVRPDESNQTTLENREEP